MNQAEHSEVIITFSKNHGVVTGGDDFGSFFGQLSIGRNRSVQMMNNTNSSDIITEGNAGGFIEIFVNSATMVIANCSNNGSINVHDSHNYVGGVIGEMNGTGTNSSIGGFIGLATENRNLTLEINHSANHFDISSQRVNQTHMTVPQGRGTGAWAEIDNF